MKFMKLIKFEATTDLRNDANKYVQRVCLYRSTKGEQFGKERRDNA